MCQRYNLKANHNSNWIGCLSINGVYQCVKDTIWKQITTVLWIRSRSLQVFISVSKIQFESKSQHIAGLIQDGARCLSVCQRYNLKANHNGVEKGGSTFFGVYQCVKDTIWKQITTKTLASNEALSVFISVSKIQFESKSQHARPNTSKWMRCLSVCQRYNLKANHN